MQVVRTLLTAVTAGTAQLGAVRDLALLQCVKTCVDIHAAGMRVPWTLASCRRRMPNVSDFVFLSDLAATPAATQVMVPGLDYWT